ncbi:unnamed protein product [Didymodactylos carnosus]|uniref:Egal-1 winged helix domain-containing protein n=1 Tax=Didymodactylos carnosus TaxID=1234261 RepID=A0A8S2Q1K4_9BILA|nr:unnamed protein product [Didymodactylos carnosus]CAF4076612.1 unnamed protein product [Didymodactylos carnosus]
MAHSILYSLKSDLLFIQFVQRPLTNIRSTPVAYLTTTIPNLGTVKRSWDKGKKKKIEEEAISFFKQQIKNSNQQSLSIGDVYEHMGEASPDVRALISGNIKHFLKRFPDIFVVGLTHSALKADWKLLEKDLPSLYPALSTEPLSKVKHKYKFYDANERVMLFKNIGPNIYFVDANLVNYYIRNAKDYEFFINEVNSKRSQFCITETTMKEVSMYFGDVPKIFTIVNSDISMDKKELMYEEVLEATRKITSKNYQNDFNILIEAGSSCFAPGLSLFPPNLPMLLTANMRFVSNIIMRYADILEECINIWGCEHLIQVIGIGEKNAVSLLHQ